MVIVPKKTFCDHAEDVLKEHGRMEASRLKDLVWEKMQGNTPGIRAAVAMLRKDGRFVSREAYAWKKQIKTWELKNAPEKKFPEKKLSDDF